MKELNQLYKQGYLQGHSQGCRCKRADLQRSFAMSLSQDLAKLTNGFKEAGKQHGFNLVVSGEPALFYLRIANDDSLMLHQEWIAECVSRGLFLASHHNHFMNAAVTDDDIKLAIDIAEDAETQSFRCGLQN